MQNSTRVAYAAYLAQLALINSVSASDLGSKFTVDPTVSQRLESKIQESSDFLGRVNMVPVSEQEGEKIGLGVSGLIAGTTDTTANDRATRDMSALDSQTYRCEKTDFDTHIKYAQLDAWAKFPDFQTRLRDAILRRMALDRIVIGFNGTSRSATSNRATNPLLQDVNKGWLQQLRERAPQRVMAAQEVGATKAYLNMDALVYDVVNSLIEPWFRDAPEMVVVCGRDLLADKYFPVLNNVENQRNSERVAADVIMSAQRIGGLPAVTVPYFPANKLLVTRLDNLSIYWQEGSRRRSVIDNPKRDRVENYESVNEGYVLEDLGAAAMVEGVTLV